jgi:hypothetical protein
MAKTYAASSARGVVRGDILMAGIGPELVTCVEPGSIHSIRRASEGKIEISQRWVFGDQVDVSTRGSNLEATGDRRYDGWDKRLVEAGL